MEQISVREAADSKGCTRQTINTAIRQGKIDAAKIGSYNVVLVTDKFNAWNPNPKSQAAGRSRWEDPDG